VSTDEFGIDETTATSIPPMQFRIDVGDVDPLSDRACRMTHAHSTGIELRETLRDGASLRAAVSGVTLYTEHLEDGYPDWHPAPDSFRGMLRLFIYQEITGDSYERSKRTRNLPTHSSWSTSPTSPCSRGPGAIDSTMVFVST